MGPTRNRPIPTVAIVGLFVAIWSAVAIGYPRYRETGSTTANPVPSCYSCHPGFFNRGALHNPLHVGSTKMTNTCTLCHTSTGDIPRTNTSGADPGHACNGCHTGPGLRLHHAAAGVPADSTGYVCADCHDDPAPPYSEALPFPPYYTRQDVNVKNPCVVDAASGGEDLSGDGKGLDNDGDQLYDANDTDCGVVPTNSRTWGGIKSLYRSPR
jgi:hypothetical protein